MSFFIRKFSTFIKGLLAGVLPLLFMLFAAACGDKITLQPSPQAAPETPVAPPAGQGPLAPNAPPVSAPVPPTATVPTQVQTPTPNVPAPPPPPPPSQVPLRQVRPQPQTPNVPASSSPGSPQVSPPIPPVPQISQVQPRIPNIVVPLSPPPGPISPRPQTPTATPSTNIPPPPPSPPSSTTVPSVSQAGPPASTYTLPPNLPPIPNYPPPLLPPGIVNPQHTPSVTPANQPSARPLPKPPAGKLPPSPPPPSKSPGSIQQIPSQQSQQQPPQVSRSPGLGAQIIAKPAKAGKVKLPAPSSSLQAPTEELLVNSDLLIPQKILYGFDAQDNVIPDDEGKKLSAYIGLLGSGPSKKESIKLYVLGPAIGTSSDLKKNYASFFDDQMNLRYPVELMNDSEKGGTKTLTHEGKQVIVDEYTKLPKPVLVELFDPIVDNTEIRKADNQLIFLQASKEAIQKSMPRKFLTASKADRLRDISIFFKDMEGAIKAIKFENDKMVPELERHMNTFIQKADNKELSDELTRVETADELKELLTNVNATQFKENLDLLNDYLVHKKTSCDNLKTHVLPPKKVLGNITGKDKDTLKKFCPLVPFVGFEIDSAQKCVASIINDRCSIPTDQLLAKVKTAIDMIPSDMIIVPNKPMNISKNELPSFYEKAIRAVYEKLKVNISNVDPEIQKVEQQKGDEDLKTKLLKIRGALEEEEEEEDW